MADSKLNVGIVGAFQNGKSTFVNCLLDDLVARTGGEGVSVTSVNTKYVYGEMQSVTYLSRSRVVHRTTLKEFIETKKFPMSVDEIYVTLWKPILRKINVIDTPGFNANEEDSSMAISSLNGVDVAIVVINNRGLSSVELTIIKKLKERNIPFYILMNCMNVGGKSWLPESNFNKEKCDNIIASLETKNLIPQKINGQAIWIANFLWFWYVSEQYQCDMGDKRETLLDDIECYARKNDRVNVDIEYLKVKSEFLAIRKAFDDDSNWGFPMSSIRWRAALDKTFSQWEAKLEEIVKKY